jgi:hypothetical protein
MAEAVDEPLMLDPSAVLGDRGFAWLAEISPFERRFVVSNIFVDQVGGSVTYSEADVELWGPLPEGAARTELRELLGTLTVFSGENVSEDLPPEVVEVANRLREFGSLVAVEEWLYLQTNSWLGARTRNIFDHFRRAGSHSLEVAGDALDTATWLALGKFSHAPAALTAKQRERAGINIVIVGGVAALGVLVPWLGVPGAIVGFLLQPVLNAH